MRQLVPRVCTTAFLDISVAGKHHGRVYLQMFETSRRGLQFTSFCTGEQGPSYRRCQFSRFYDLDKVRERVYVKGCKTSDDKVVPALLENLESDSKKVMVGCLAGPRPGDSTPTRFWIYTKEYNDLSVYAFGKVTEGLDFLKSSMNHCPISDVVIEDCGVVINK